MARKIVIGVCAIFPSILLGAIARYVLTGVDNLPGDGGLRWVATFIMAVISIAVGVASLD